MMPYVIILLSTSIILASVPKRNLYVIPKKDNVSVYENRIRKLNENSKFVVNLKSRLRVLETKKDSYKVQNDKGRVGWIKKRFVAPLKNASYFEIDSLDVIGHIDFFSFSSIIDNSDPEGIAIKLDRSFKEALGENIDRESVQRVIE